MRFGRGKYFRKIVSYYVIPFLCILLIISMSIYYIMSRNIQDSFLTACSTSASGLSQTIDTEMSKLFKSAVMLFNVVNALQPYVIDNNGDLVMSYYEMNNIKNILSAIKATNAYYERILIYFPRFSRIITNEGAFLFDEYYTLYPYYTDVDEALFGDLDSINDSHFYPMAKVEKTADNVKYVIPMFTRDNGLSLFNTSISFNLNCAFFSDALSQYALTDHSMLVITDSGGSLIFTSDSSLPSQLSKTTDTVTLEHTDYHVTHDQVEFTGWNVFLLVEKNAYSFELQRFLQGFIASAVLFLAFFVLLTIYLSRRLYQPIKMLLNTVHERVNNRHTHEIDLVAEHIVSLQSNQNRLEQDFTHVIDMVREDVLRRIIMYGDDSLERQELDEMLEKYVIQLDTRYYLTGIIQVYYKPHELSALLPDAFEVISNMVYAVLSSAFSRFSPDGMINLIRIDAFRYLLIIGSNDPSCHTKINMFFNKAANDLSKAHSYVQPVLALSPPQEDFLALSAQYQILCEQFEYFNLRSDTYLLDSHSMDMSVPPSLPPEFDSSLKAAVMTKQLSSISEILKVVFDRTFSSSVTYRNFYLLMERLLDVYNRIAEELHSNLITFSCLNQNLCIKLLNIDASYDYCLSLFRQIAEFVDKPKIGKQLVEYVKQHFNESNFCLTELAEQFHFNENYLSRLFKIETGQTFTEFLCDYRIQYAKQLLSHNEMRIDDISVMVGFASRRSLNRVLRSILIG